MVFPLYYIYKKKRPPNLEFLSCFKLYLFFSSVFVSNLFLLLLLLVFLLLPKDQNLCLYAYWTLFKKRRNTNIRLYLFFFFGFIFLVFLDMRVFLIYYCSKVFFFCVFFSFFFWLIIWEDDGWWFPTRTIKKWIEIRFFFLLNFQPKNLSVKWRRRSFPNLAFIHAHLRLLVNA